MPYFFVFMRRLMTLIAAGVCLFSMLMSIDIIVSVDLPRSAMLGIDHPTFRLLLLTLFMALVSFIILWLLRKFR